MRQPPMILSQENLTQRGIEMKAKKILWRLKEEKSELLQGYMIEETGPAILINEKEYYCYPKWYKKDDLEIIYVNPEDAS